MSLKYITSAKINWTEALIYSLRKKLLIASCSKHRYKEKGRRLYIQQRHDSYLEYTNITVLWR